MLPKMIDQAELSYTARSISRKWHFYSSKPMKSDFRRFDHFFAIFCEFSTDFDRFRSILTNVTENVTGGPLQDALVIGSNRPHYGM